MAVDRCSHQEQASAEAEVAVPGTSAETDMFLSAVAAIVVFGSVGHSMTAEIAEHWIAGSVLVAWNRASAGQGLDSQ